jgi:hypothetical protein
VKPSQLHGPVRAESGRRLTCDGTARPAIRVTPISLTLSGANFVSRLLRLRMHQEVTNGNGK